MSAARHAARERSAALERRAPLGRSPALARSAALVLLAAGAFLAVAAAVRARVPWPQESGLAAKLEHLAAHGERYDVLVIGSSRTFRGVDPGVLDAAAAQAGLAIRSVNLALPGMTAFEAEALLRHVLETRLVRPRVALVEALPWEAGEDWARNALSDRSVQWHTPALTALALAAVAHADLPRARAWALRAAHGRAALRRLVAYGQGRRWIDAWRGRVDPDALTSAEVARDAGFVALDDAREASVAARRAAFLAAPEAYAQEVDRLATRVPRADDGRGYALDALAAQQRVLARHGVRPVYFTTPSTFAVAWAPILASAGRLPDLLVYNDPRAFPELYAPDVRFDRDHLDREGARRFSTRLGRDLAAALGDG